jgi:hypothetical protein
MGVRTLTRDGRMSQAGVGDAHAAFANVSQIGQDGSLSPVQAPPPPAAPASAPAAAAPVSPSPAAVAAAGAHSSSVIATPFTPAVCSRRVCSAGVKLDWSRH